MTHANPTRNHPGVVWAEGMVVVYWKEDDGWHAIRQGVKGEIGITPAIRQAIENDQRHAAEKE
jgi:hypothetical protein